MAIFPVLGKPTHIYVCVGMSDVIACLAKLTQIYMKAD